MPPPRPRFEIQHPCLLHPRRSTPLGVASLSDRERIGVLLEGCALDAHLARIGLRPAASWEAARVSSDGRLVAVAIERGGAHSTTVATALDRATLLLRGLFPGDDRNGRGEGRRVARELVRRWLLYLTPVGPDDLVADVLEMAAFLWRERFAAYRESLAASIGGDGTERLSIAGPARFRRRVIERASTLPAVSLLRSGEAQALWRGESTAEEPEVREPRAMSWPAAATSRPLDRLITVHRWGHWRAVLVEAERLRRDGEAAGREFEIARRAVDAQLHRWRFDRAAEWAAFAANRACGDDAEAAGLLGAWVEWERAAARPEASSGPSPVGVAGAAPSIVLESREPPSGDSIESLLLWSRIEMEHRPGLVIERLAAALGDRSRAISIDRGRLWLELGRARRIAGCGERPSAERAFEHALRHLRRGDHRVELWRAAAMLLVERVGRGELVGAGLVAAGLSDQARSAGDLRRELAAAVIETRVDLARGDPERAASASRQVLDRLPATLGDRSRAELERLHLEARARCDGAKPPSPAPQPRPGGALLGESRALHDALRRLERLAVGDLPVLLYGETGTGKELAAKRLHSASPRRERPFVAVNCAALSESLLLSELFGHARGAFTGADRDRAGVFETAHGGAVFLDEIGDLPSGAQGALLRVLQEGEVRRVGESRARRVDVRVVAATHRRLDALVDRGAFRQDLYYRLNVAVVRLPPLRERGDDVLLLARHFLSAYDGRLRLARDAEQLLLACAWPGNVRELRSVLQVAAAMHDGDGWLLARDLELPPGPRIATSYHGALDAERRRLLGEALSAASGRRAEAARRLGITPQAVSYLIRRLGLDAP
ncbi:MAG TPA: sigma 54-interacting transcriptional regulator [Thermoanaerobaculia bacterium]|nr:sigma 54-interacting transcriptional regulator [Thermoanaerobaculia bacterium]